jgi:hypothetical protein
VRRIAGVVCLLVAATAGCGKKGLPLPPFIDLPAAPADFSVTRRASDVAIQLVVPKANTDGSSPADLERIDIFALDGAATMPLEDVLKRGTRVAQIKIAPPPDPDDENDTKKSAPATDAGRAGADDTAAAEPAPEGDSQGATARVRASMENATGGVAIGVARSFVAVGVNRRGRRGALSTRALVSLAEPPAPPAAPRVSYTETSINVAWPASADAGGPSVTYHVYGAGASEVRLTDRPVGESQFADTRVEWGAERCYVVRAIEAVGNLTIESEASPKTCVTLTDTFPPKTPTGLQAIASEGAVNLIWEANDEADLGGYVVSRAVAPEANLVRVTPEPLSQATFTDAVPAGTRVIYAVQAVDKAGNISAPSDRVAETAR